jgi:hypothetical protein
VPKCSTHACTLCRRDCSCVRALSASSVSCPVPNLPVPCFLCGVHQASHVHSSPSWELNFTLSTEYFNSDLDIPRSGTYMVPHFRGLPVQHTMLRTSPSCDEPRDSCTHTFQTKPTQTWKGSSYCPSYGDIFGYVFIQVKQHVWF